MSNTLHLSRRGGVRPIARPNPLAEAWRAWVRAWRRAFEAMPHDTIDDITLRDLGMSRSELGSYAAEASGRAELTRLRVIASHGLHARSERAEFE
jgi:hypothetical protein